MLAVAQLQEDVLGQSMELWLGHRVPCRHDLHRTGDCGEPGVVIRDPGRPLPHHKTGTQMWPAVFHSCALLQGSVKPPAHHYGLLCAAIRSSLAARGRNGFFSGGDTAASDLTYAAHAAGLFSVKGARLFRRMKPLAHLGHPRVRTVMELTDGNRRCGDQ